MQGIPDNQRNEVLKGQQTAHKKVRLSAVTTAAIVLDASYSHSQSKTNKKNTLQKCEVFFFNNFPTYYALFQSLYPYMPAHNVHIG